MTTAMPAWYTSQELTPSGECRGGGEHEWVPEGNATYLRCYKGNESADIHLVDDDGLCLNCGEVHWKLPPADAEQQHLVDEISDPRFVDAAQHEFADRCGEACACKSAPITIRLCTMPEEAGQ